MRRSEANVSLLGENVKRTAARAAVAVSLLLAAGCMQRVEDSPAYRAACHGPPLHGAAAFEQAQVEGYTINRVYDCIDKASYEAVAAQKAQYEAANTPQAIAQRDTEWAQTKAAAAAQRERDDWQRERDAERAARELQQAEDTPVPAVDVNRASETEIANVTGIGAETARRIVQERRRRRFANWPDLVQRIDALRAAQPATFASVCGLNVDGKSLDGAPPNGALAAALRKRLETDRR